LKPTHWLPVVAGLIGLSMPGCVKQETVAKAEAPRMELIAVSESGTSFVQKGRGGPKPWTPWGFNYDHDESPEERLIEDYWDAEWDKVSRDFHAMRAMGTTLVRIHLELPRFMDGPTQVNARSLAEREGLYLDVTGLADYRPSSVAAWYVALAEPERWATQSRFWEAVATQAAESPAVFCFNVMNEPALPESTSAGLWPPAWVNGRTYVEFISRDLAGRPRADVGRAWLRTMVAAIRKHDTRHLVTVGAFTVFEQAQILPFGLSARETAAEVDFLSIHLYPKSGALEVASKELGELAVGKPVLVEESGPLECTVNELRRVMEASRGKVTGWLGFFWGKSLEEYARSDLPKDRFMAEWLTSFLELRPK
jgi:hypothetical protein